VYKWLNRMKELREALEEMLMIISEEIKWAKKWK
jgi:hypothetical protein